MTSDDVPSWVYRLYRPATQNDPTPLSFPLPPLMSTKLAKGHSIGGSTDRSTLILDGRQVDVVLDLSGPFPHD